MDNENASKFISALDDITSQEKFLIGIQDMITRRTGTPTHLFHDTLQCLAKLKEMVRAFRHVSDREAGRKIRREWLQRQRGRQVHVDVNWCCICHKSGCILE
jgi:hypothetical protein